MGVIDRQASPETVSFKHLLSTLKQGEGMTYEQMSLVLGFDPRSHLAKLYGVRDGMRRRGEAVIEIVPKVGIRRLEDSEVVNRHASQYLKRTSRSAGRGAGANSSVNYAALSQADQTRHNVTQAAFGAMRLLSTKRSQSTIEEGMQQARVTLPPRDVLSLFSKK